MNKSIQDCWKHRTSNSLHFMLSNLFLYPFSFQSLTSTSECLHCSSGQDSDSDWPAGGWSYEVSVDTSQAFHWSTGCQIPASYWSTGSRLCCNTIQMLQNQSMRMMLIHYTLVNSGIRFPIHFWLDSSPRRHNLGSLSDCV